MYSTLLIYYKVISLKLLLLILVQTSCYYSNYIYFYSLLIPFQFLNKAIKRKRKISLPATSLILLISSQISLKVKVRRATF